jgi:UDP-2,3-diacylglucosamine hydrolase
MKYFISDLHLSAQEPHITAAFLRFLKHIAPTGDALYILGDFFESYIGDDDNDPYVASIADALLQLAQTGLPIYLMHGNRDFLIGNTFAKTAGVTLIPDPTIITIANQPLLLMHGDSLCTLDKNHQRFRKITRNKIIQTLFLWLPLSFRKKLAADLRTESMKENHYKSAEIMDVSENAVDQAIQQYQADKLIHGHTHRPMITNKRIVLGSWEKQGNYLKIDEQGNIEAVLLKDVLP